MKKLVLWCSILFIIATMPGCAFSDSQEPTEKPPGMRRIKEESYFVDYEIDGDIIRFRYALCFENSLDDDLSVSIWTASFKKSETKGWLKNDGPIVGYVDNYERSYTIRSGEKVTVIFVFEGEYLGGPVNEELSFPYISTVLYE